MLTGKACSCIKDHSRMFERLETFPISTSAEEMTWYVKLITNSDRVVFFATFSFALNISRAMIVQWRSGNYYGDAVYLFSKRFGIYQDGSVLEWGCRLWSTSTGSKIKREPCCMANITFLSSINFKRRKCYMCQHD